MRRMALMIGLTVLVLVAICAAFELGRYYAGYNILSAIQERAKLNDSIAQLKSANTGLQARIIELETLNAGHAREDQVVARTIGELQAQVARQTEELAFYRAVVAEGAPAIGVRVGTVRLSPGKPVGRFLVHVSLVRAGKTDGMTTGRVSLTVDGQGAGGKPATLDSHALAADGEGEVPYDFRYYQELDQTVALPPGFRPEHLTVQVSSGRKDVPPLTQTFPWSAVLAP
jgi:chorismate mutase